MEEKLVSVIITTYKRKPSILKRALDSVVNQTYKNIEIIVINDAPEYDERINIDKLINMYRENNNIRYIVNSHNLGGNAARNVGIKVAKGEYIAFLDDDDEFLPEKISKCSHEFNNDVGIVYSDMYIVGENGKKRLLKRKTVNFEDQLKEILAGNYIGGFSNVIIKKEFLTNNNLLDETLSSYQDVDLWIRLATISRFIRIKEPLIKYYITDDSVSLNYEKKILGLRNFMVKHSELYNQYPNSKNIKIDSEIMNFCKNGWLSPAIFYYKEIYQGIDRWIHVKAIFKGILKYFVIRIKMKV